MRGSLWHLPGKFCAQIQYRKALVLQEQYWANSYHASMEWTLKSRFGRMLRARREEGRPI